MEIDYAVYHSFVLGPELYSGIGLLVVGLGPSNVDDITKRRPSIQAGMSAPRRQLRTQHLGPGLGSTRIGIPLWRERGVGLDGAFVLDRANVVPVLAHTDAKRTS